MANKSNTATQTISTPQGGGALHGIGETFSPDLHTGTGNFTVPIALPPGRNGFQPQLNLVYSTGNGNGPFGLGWSLSIPASAGRPRKGFPYGTTARRARYLPAFRRGGSGARRGDGRERRAIARERKDSSLGSNIAATAETDHWEVRSKDGLVSVYGTPLSIQNDPAVIANPENRSRDLQLEAHRRPTTPSATPSATTMNETWAIPPTISGISSISSGFGTRTTPIPQAGDEKFLVSVTFNYEERPDPFSEYRRGIRDPHDPALHQHRDPHPRRPRTPGPRLSIDLPRSTRPADRTAPVERGVAAQSSPRRRTRRRAPRVAAAAGIRLHGIRADAATLPAVHRRGRIEAGALARPSRNTSWSICSATVCPPCWSSTSRCATGATAAMAGSTSCAPWRRLRQGCG